MAHPGLEAVLGVVSLIIRPSIPVVSLKYAIRSCALIIAAKAESWRFSRFCALDVQSRECGAVQFWFLD